MPSVLFEKSRPRLLYIIKLRFTDQKLYPSLITVVLSGIALVTHYPRNFNVDLQNRAPCCVTGFPYTVRSAQIMEQLGWSSLTEMRMQQKAVMIYKIVYGLTPPYMRNMSNDQ